MIIVYLIGMVAMTFILVAMAIKTGANIHKDNIGIITMAILCWPATIICLVKHLIENRGEL